MWANAATRGQGGTTARGSLADGSARLAAVDELVAGGADAYVPHRRAEHHFQMRDVRLRLERQGVVRPCRGGVFLPAGKICPNRVDALCVLEHRREVMQLMAVTLVSGA